MELNKQELKLLIDLVMAKMDELSAKLAEQDDIVFDAIERGEDTEEANRYRRELDEIIDGYFRLVGKIEAMKEGCKY